MQSENVIYFLIFVLIAAIGYFKKQVAGVSKQLAEEKSKRVEDESIQTVSSEDLPTLVAGSNQLYGSSSKSSDP